MSGKPVAKRLVFHIGGYDPITSHASAQRRFVREIARFQRTWSVKATVDGSHDTADQIQWNVTTIGPDWLVETDYRLVRWHDVIEVFGGRSIGSRISVGILAFLDFVLTGTLWRYLLTNWRYALFFLYPLVMFGLLIAGRLFDWRGCIQDHRIHPYCCRWRSLRDRSRVGGSVALAPPRRLVRRLDFFLRVYSMR